MSELYSKYRPSNGTEGEIFMEQWCGTCTRDKVWSEGKPFDECDDDELCSIIANTLAYGIDDPQYPSEWTWDQHGNPCCTAWTSINEPLKQRCTRTEDMFE